MVVAAMVIHHRGYNRCCNTKQCNNCNSCKLCKNASKGPKIPNHNMHMC